eukprot:m.69329 g.69329  ORF g.69329 m.69329 type:complete len:347 (+) comp35598_c0_seq2:84-1124(+)
MSSLRVAFFGCGLVSKHHFEGYLKCGRPVELVAAIDERKERAESYADQCGAKVFTSLDEALLNCDFDAVDIMLPHDLHEWAAVKCLNSGKHVLLEKPMAISLTGCKNILDAARKSGKVFMVSENAQYWPEVVKAKNLVKEGAIGSLYYAEANYWETALMKEFDKTDSSHWTLNPLHIGGGLLMAGSSHWMRPLRMWLGEVDEVIGFTSNPLEYRLPAAYETACGALLRFRNGKTATFNALLSDGPLYDRPYFRLLGSKGELTISGGFHGKLTLYNSEHPSGEQVQPVQGYFASFPPMIKEFVLSAEGLKEPDVDASYTMGEPLIMWAIYKSMENKCWNKVEFPTMN